MDARTVLTRRGRYLDRADVEPGPIDRLIDGVGCVTDSRDGEPRDALQVTLDDGRLLTLNRQNTQTLIDLYGADTDGWIGRTIRLYLDPDVAYRGRRVGGIRIEASHATRSADGRSTGAADRSRGPRLRDDRPATDVPERQVAEGPGRHPNWGSSAAR
jgi:hypothetical protein